MKREFLKGFEGLTDEVIDKIMAENGKDIEAEKAKYTSLKTEIDTLKSDKKSLEDKITELSEKSKSADDYKKELDDLKADIKAKEDKAKADAEDAAQTEAIIATFGDKVFTSDYVKNGIIADMKSEIAKPENKGKGYAEIFDSLTKDKPGIFENPNKPADMTGLGSFENKTSEDTMRAIMGLPTNKE